MKTVLKTAIHRAVFFFTAVSNPSNLGVLNNNLSSNWVKKTKGTLALASKLLKNGAISSDTLLLPINTHEYTN